MCSKTLNNLLVHTITLIYKWNGNPYGLLHTLKLLSNFRYILWQLILQINHKDELIRWTIFFSLFQFMYLIIFHSASMSMRNTTPPQPLVSIEEVVIVPTYNLTINYKDELIRWAIFVSFHFCIIFYFIQTPCPWQTLLLPSP